VCSLFYRIFTILFIGCCVVMYATLMHNLREYYRYVSVGYVRAAALAAAAAAGVEGYEEGDVEMNVLRSASIDSNYSDDIIFPLAENGADSPTQSQLGSPSKSKGGFMPLPTSDPFDPLIGVYARDECRESDCDALMPPASPGRSLQSKRGRSGKNGAGTTTTGSKWRADISPPLSSVAGGHDPGAAEVDATLHLLSVLERINTRNAMSGEFAALRKVCDLNYKTVALYQHHGVNCLSHRYPIQKYELMVPQDGRVRFSKQVRKPGNAVSGGSTLSSWCQNVADQLCCLVRSSAGRAWRILFWRTETQQKARSV
jgi:hypothetical protein